MQLSTRQNHDEKSQEYSKVQPNETDVRILEFHVEATLCAHTTKATKFICTEKQQHVLLLHNWQFSGNL